MSKRYFEKLNNNRFNAIKKIELSVIGDANMLLTETEEFKAMADGVFNEYKDRLDGVGFDLESVQAHVKNMEGTMDNASKGLQLVRKAGESLMDTLDGATKLQKEVQKSLEKIEKSAEDLGVKVDNIDVYKKLVSQDNVIEGYIDNMAKKLDEGREVIGELISESRKLNKISSLE